MGIPILDPSAWGSKIKGAYQDAQRKVASVLANPEKAQRDADAAAKELRAARTALDAWKAKLGKLSEADRAVAVPKYNRAAREWYELASAFYRGSADAKTLRQTTEIGIVPIIVAGVVLAGAAVAFAPAAYQYARSLRTYADTQSRELDARIDASKEGRRLQESTVPPPAGSKNKGISMGWVVGGGVALLLVGGGIYAMKARS